MSPEPSYDLSAQVDLASSLVDVLIDDLEFDLVEDQDYMNKFISETVVPSFRWLTPRIKHPGFAEEKETRLVCHEPKGSEVYVRPLGGKLIPYVKFPVPEGTIFSVMVGPNSDFHRVLEAVSLLFERSRYKLEFLMDCQIPYDGI